GKDGGKFLADEYEIPFLGQIPLVQNICEGGDQGIPVLVGDDEITSKAFEGFAAQVVRSIAMRNANLSEEKITATV
ncbi:MAG TPA: MRP family ATP-binding protein, partial [Chitinophagaceae bacterium]|nr:MRP family ATP-binding protein [Chitinophagaceae bacterium]